MAQTPAHSRLYAWLPPLLGFVVYIPTFWFGFVWDDRFVIVQNTAALSNWSTFRQIWFGPYDQTVSMFRPITSCIGFLSFQAFHVAPAGYHILSVLLHVVMCALVFRFALVLTSDATTAALAGCLFALHPIHIEAVAWVSTFAEPLVGIFILCGLLTYVRYRDTGRLLTLALFCFFLFAGLLTKENAIVLPVIALIYEFIAADRTTRQPKRILSAAVAVIVTVAIYGALRLHLFTHVAPVETPLRLPVLFYTLPSVFVFYLQKLVVPFPTSGFYDENYVVGLNADFWVPILILLAVAVIVAFAARRSTRPGLVRFCWLSMPVCLIPFLDLQVFQFREIAHDRFLYLPSVFFCIYLAQLFFHDAPRPASDAPPRAIYRQFAVVTLVAYAALVIVESRPWHDDVAFYAHAHQVAPNNPRPAYGLAQVYLIDGNLTGAERALSDLVVHTPAPKAFEQLGQIRMQLGRAAAAEDAFRHALAAAPNRPGLHSQLAQALQAQGKSAEAQTESEREQALQFAP